MAVYFYTLHQDMVFNLPNFAPATDVVVRNKTTNQVVFEFTKEGKLTVCAGYAWDGCTPKLRLGPFVFGIWDGAWDFRTGRPQLYVTSLLHDVLVQVRQLNPKNVTYRYKDNDKLFLHNAQYVAEFSMAKLYYSVLRAYDILYFWRK